MQGVERETGRAGGSSMAARGYLAADIAKHRCAGCVRIVIDLYYLHRMGQRRCRSKRSVGALAESEAPGKKIRAIGLSEVSACDPAGGGPRPCIRFAAVQSEYSLCTRNPEDRGCSEPVANIGPAALVAFQSAGRAAS